MQSNKIEEKENEGGFLLKLLQLEKFVNKYKFQLIGIVVVLFVGFVGVEVNNYLKEQNLIKTNTAYNKLLQNPNDKQSLKILKENKKLYQLYLLQTTNKDVNKLQTIAQSHNGIVSNLAKYQLAMLKGDINSLENYALGIGAIYKDLALLNEQRLYLKNNNHKKAQDILNEITDDNIKQISQGLLHYGIVK